MPDKDDYKVGYGKPPRHRQFQKGQSGNPRGRPKAAKNLGTVLGKALNERVAVNENGRRRTISKLEAMIKQLANKGASGNLQVARLVMEFLQQAEARAEASVDQPIAVGEDDRQVMERTLQRIRRLAERGEDAGPDAE